ncbi:zinc finger, CCHC-type containing protein, partial [Tanacetum coccineum]
GSYSIECIFVGYAEHSKAFRFYVIEPNESVSINSIIKSRDVIFDENIFSSVPRPSQKSLINGTDNLGGLVVLEVVTEEVVVQQPEPELRKSKRSRTPKNFGPKFQLNLIEGTRDEVPKKWHQKFDTVVLSNGYLLNQAEKYVYRKFYESGKGVIICLYIDDMLIFGTDQVQVDLTKEFLSLKFSIKDMEEADVILMSTPTDTSEKPIPNNGQAVSQLEYSKVIGYLMYAMTCTRPDIAFVVGKLSSNYGILGEY